uniref:MATH domain-containing protein n=1 Tax=Strigamia maritima TaxID=126957 RepID=T1J8R5_STRMM
MDPEIFTCIKCGLKSTVQKELLNGPIYCQRCGTKSNEKATGSSDSLSEKELCIYCNSKINMDEMKSHNDECDMYPINCNFCNRKFIRRTGNQLEVERHESGNFHNELMMKKFLDLQTENLSSFDIPFQTNKELSRKVNELEKCIQKQSITISHLLKAVDILIQSEQIEMKQTYAKDKNKMETLYNEQKQELMFVRNELLPLYTTGCYIWKIEKFSHHKFMANIEDPYEIYSEPFYSSEFGYKMQLVLCLNDDCTEVGNYLSVHIHLMKGLNDAFLKWPVLCQAELSILDALTHAAHYSYTVESNIGFDKPLNDENVDGFGLLTFISLNEIKPEHLVHDIIFLKLDNIILNAPLMRDR